LGFADGGMFPNRDGRKGRRGEFAGAYFALRVGERGFAQLNLVT
jgi:hypothetical protein